MGSSITGLPSLFGNLQHDDAYSCLSRRTSPRILRSAAQLDSEVRRGRVPLLNVAETLPSFQAVDSAAPPHFLKTGRLIALYGGEKPSVLIALQDALGPQFAGR
jgi:hypothetical protein